ncbi:hypothetical protein [Ruegeria marina]|uniref:Uncharacterized protein n=1 Tax=Ruegeria marina TaxID=639004 RepID=A0A1G6S3W2_9RHOB|nr:hypothetical protein [Ruegeria marina]SDD10875.1 hypothetical protein SAMN04488239_105148 [Ruegeria marina]
MTGGRERDPAQMQPPPVFLERQSYRRRRLMDAARLLPILGAALFAVPLLWPNAGEGGVRMSVAITYVFGVWAALILISAGFGIAARMVQPGDQAEAERKP